MLPSAASVLVTVVPMLAPMIIGTASSSGRVPAPTSADDRRGGHRRGLDQHREQDAGEQAGDRVGDLVEQPVLEALAERGDADSSRPTPTRNT
jgi:hypothetical protein